jgi:hypothetical protein
MYLQVYRPSGRPQGTLNLSLKLGHVYQRSATAAPFAGMPPQTVKPNNITNYPARSPNGYNQAGGNQYPQYPPQHPPQSPQFHPPVMGPPGYAVLPPTQGTPLRRYYLSPGSLLNLGLRLGEAFSGGGCGGGGCGA